MPGPFLDLSLALAHCQAVAPYMGRSCSACSSPARSRVTLRGDVRALRAQRRWNKWVRPVLPAIAPLSTIVLGGMAWSWIAT